MAATNLTPDVKNPSKGFLSTCEVKVSDNKGSTTFYDMNLLEKFHEDHGFKKIHETFSLENYSLLMEQSKTTHPSIGTIFNISLKVYEEGKTLGEISTTVDQNSPYFDFSVKNLRVHCIFID